MRKYGGDDGQPPVPKISHQMLEDVKNILRKYPSGDQNPKLELSLEDLKAQLKQAGHNQVVSSHIKSAFLELQQDRLITYNSDRAGWVYILWRSPNI